MYLIRAIMRVAVVSAVASAASAGSPTTKSRTEQPIGAAEAKRIIALRMIDPSSTQFRSIRQVPAIVDGQNANLVCGEFNSRNRFGGYVGFSSFAYLVDKGELVTGSGDIYDAAGGNRLITSDAAPSEPFYPPRASSSEIRVIFQSWMDKANQKVEADKKQFAYVKAVLAQCQQRS